MINVKRENKRPTITGEVERNECHVLKILILNGHYPVMILKERALDYSGF